MNEVGKANAMTVKLEKAAIVAGYLSPSDSEIELSQRVSRGWKKVAAAFNTNLGMCSRQHASESRSNSAAARTKRLLCSLDEAVWGSSLGLMAPCLQ